MMQSSILVIHICAGVVGCWPDGGDVVPKGFPTSWSGWKCICRRYAGDGINSVVPVVLKGQSGLGGLFACYLVITAWSTARRRRGEMNLFDWGALLFALELGVPLHTVKHDVQRNFRLDVAELIWRTSLL